MYTTGCNYYTLDLQHNNISGHVYNKLAQVRTNKNSSPAQGEDTLNLNITSTSETLNKIACCVKKSSK